MKRSIQKYIATAIVLLLLGGCVKEYPLGVVNEEATITLRLYLPYTGNDGTRAIAPEPNPLGENRIDNIDILALTLNGSDWVFDYQADIVDKVQNGSELIITAKCRGMSTEQQFVILVNASENLINAAPARFEKITDIENRLICSKGGGEWPAKNNGSSEFFPFPMYARTKAHVVNPTNNSIADTGGEPYRLYRMVSRIDVTLKSDINNFKLVEACLFNYKKAGYISYHKSGFNGTSATTPAVPTSGDHSGTPILKPTVTYLAANTGEGVDPRGEILSSIYTFESPAITSDAGKNKGTALVIGGKYNGSDAMSYYRIDLKTEDDPSSNISSGILRNHNYVVEIQSVTGSGSGSAEDAYSGPPVIKAVISKWDLNNMAVIADGEHSLILSRDKMVTDTKGFNNAELSINTDATSGIYIDLIADKLDTPTKSWLTCTNGTGADGATSRTIKLSVSSYTGDTPRTTAFRIRVKNMYYYLTVKQYGKPAVTAAPEARYQTDGKRHTFTVTPIGTDIHWYPALKSVGPTTSNPLIIDAMDYTVSSLTFRSTASTKEDGSAVITITDPAGLWSVDVPVKIINCGMGSTPIRSYIGSYQGGYMTIMYGNKCWMLENSKENPEKATATYYGESGGFGNELTGIPINNEHYYIWANVSNSAGCPPGWVTPSLSDIASKATVGTEAEIIMPYITETGTGQYWFEQPALCGYATSGIADNGINSPLNNLWTGWRVEGHWSFIGNPHASFKSNGSKILMSGATNGNIYSLRCVKVM